MASISPMPTAAIALSSLKSPRQLEEENLEKTNTPWVAPSLIEAKGRGRELIWERGLRSYWSTSFIELGSMGPGMALYFWMTLSCAIALLICSILTLPSMVLNWQGNNGYAIAVAEQDGMGFAALSFGNEGLNAALVSAADCRDIGGDVDCTGTTVVAFGRDVKAERVAVVIGLAEAAVAITLSFFIGYVSGGISSRVEAIDTANATPADYAIFVRGLPASATHDQIRRHFSDRYDLTKRQPDYPVLGLSLRGVGFFFGLAAALAAALLLAPAAAATAAAAGGGPTIAGGAAAACVVVASIVTYGVVVCFNIGGARLLPTLAEAREEAAQRRKNKALMLIGGAGGGRSVRIVPYDGGNTATEAGAAPTANGSSGGVGTLSERTEILPFRSGDEESSAKAAGADKLAAARTVSAPPSPRSSPAAGSPRSARALVASPESGTIAPTPAITGSRESSGSFRISDGGDSPRGGGSPRGKGPARPRNGSKTGGENGSSRRSGSGGGGGDGSATDAMESGHTGSAITDSPSALATPKEAVATTTAPATPKRTGEAMALATATPKGGSADEVSGRRSATSPTAAAVAAAAAAAGPASPSSAAAASLPPIATSDGNPLPCGDCRNTKDIAYLGGWVSDVATTNPIGPVLRYFLQEQKFLDQFADAQARVRRCRTVGTPSQAAAAEAALVRLVGREEKLMARAAARSSPAAGDVVTGAFVIFEHEESQRRCLRDYRHSGNRFCRFFQPKWLRFAPDTPGDDGDDVATGGGGGNGGGESCNLRRLRVCQAPEPSDVFFENLDVPRAEQWLRRGATTVCVLLILVASFGVIYKAQEKQVAIAAAMPDLSACYDTVPASFYGTYDLPDPLVLARNTDGDAACQAQSSDLWALTWEGGNDATPLNFTALPPLLDADGTDAVAARSSFSSDGGDDDGGSGGGSSSGGVLCDDECQSSSDTSACATLACGTSGWAAAGYPCASYAANMPVNCYCLEALTMALATRGLLSGARYALETDGDVCASFLKNYTAAYAIKLLAVAIVVLVNVLLKAVMAALVRFEYHSSVSSHALSLTAKLAVAQFANTALIIVAINASFGGGSGVLKVFQTVGLLDGSYGDFTHEWYATVGVSVTLTMFLNIFIPHVGPLASALVVQPLKRLARRRSCASQRELDRLYKPPTFSIELRYATLLQALFVTLFYAGGLPILYPFAAVNFFLSFLIDKLFVLRLCHQPPMYNDRLARFFAAVLPWGLLMHIGVTLYMLGGDQILIVGYFNQRAEDFAASAHGFSAVAASHVLRKGTVALFLVGVGIAAWWLGRLAVGDAPLRAVRHVFRCLFSCICCCCRRHGMRSGDGSPGRMAAAAAYTEASAEPEEVDQPGYTAVFRRQVEGGAGAGGNGDGKGGSGGSGSLLSEDERRLGWRLTANGTAATWHFDTAGWGAGPVYHDAGEARRTWQAMAEHGPYNYVLEEAPRYAAAARAMRKAGYRNAKSLKEGAASTTVGGPSPPTTRLQGDEDDSAARGGGGCGGGGRGAFFPVTEDGIATPPPVRPTSAARSENKSRGGSGGGGEETPSKSATAAAEGEGAFAAVAAAEGASPPAMSKRDSSGNGGAERMAVVDVTSPTGDGAGIDGGDDAGNSSDSNV